MGVGTPVIVGERIYLLSEPHDLICIRKADGKVLWLRRASAFEAASGEEKKHPAYQEAEAIAAKIDAINSGLCRRGRFRLAIARQEGRTRKGPWEDK